MIYNMMDPELIEINSIKNLHFVKFYDLTTSEKNKTIILPALMIDYDYGKKLNYSAKDKYFKVFVSKVIEVYRNEKDIDVSGYNPSPSLIKRGLEIDSRSKSILENANLDLDNVLSFYKNKDGFDNSLMYEQDEIKSVIDITRYAIMDFASFANVNVELSDNTKGYRTNYIIEAKINDLFNYLLLHYNKIDENNYEISIGNMGGANKPLIINISFTDNSIYIKSRYQDLSLVNEFSFRDNKGIYLKEVFKNGDMVKYDTGELEECHDFSYNNLLFYEDNNKRTWYQLPWDAFIGGYTEKEELDKDTFIYHDNVTYLDINEDNYNKREFYNKKLDRRNTPDFKSISVVLDEFREITFGFEKKPYYIIETYFRKARGNGEYQQNFNGKYFYHIVKAKDLSEIKRDRLIHIKKAVINDKADLLSDVKLKKIGGKR